MSIRNALATGVALVVGGCSLLTSTSGFDDGSPPEGSDAGDGSVSPADGGDAQAVADAAADGSKDGDAPKGYRDNVLADSPLAYWRLGETTGVLAKDEMNQFPGVYKNGVALGMAGAIAGDPDPAPTFDGIDDFVDMGDVLDFASGAAFSVEMWFNATTIDGVYRNVFAKIGNAGSGYNGYSVYVQQTLGLHFVICRDDNNSCPSPRIPAPPTTNVWHHIVGTYGASEARFYYDGVFAVKTTISYVLTDNPYVFLIGSESEGGNFKGSIDEVAVYDHVLSAERVTAHYKAGIGQ